MALLSGTLWAILIHPPGYALDTLFDQISSGLSPLGDGGSFGSAGALAHDITSRLL